MQLSTPDFSRRAQLTELMDEPCSRDVLRACLRDIARTNRWTFAYRPLLHWLDGVIASIADPNEPLRILDVGCGYGDGLRRIEQWAASRRISVELTGLDLNPDATAIAAEATTMNKPASLIAHLPERWLQPVPRWWHRRRPHLPPASAKNSRSSGFPKP